MQKRGILLCHEAGMSRDHDRSGSEVCTGLDHTTIPDLVPKSSRFPAWQWAVCVQSVGWDREEIVISRLN